MNQPLLYEIEAYWIALGIFILILVANWLGFLYKKSLEKKPHFDENATGGSMESSMLGLVALLLGFSFSMAISKFDSRRQTIIEEANSIKTVILRTDLFPDSIRNAFRADLKEYLDARIAYYEADAEADKIDSALQRTNLYSMRLWRRSAQLAQDFKFVVGNQQMIPALKGLMDIVTVRESARLAKVPPIILFMLSLLTLISAFLVGYNYKGKRRNRVLVFVFSLMTTIAFYLILELDRPRRGLLNLNAAEKNIIDLQQLLNESPISK